MWIRHVLVPSINDQQEYLEGLRDFIKTLNTVKKIEVLGYHTMGVSKWRYCDEDYPLEGIPAATSEDVKRAEEILEVKK